MMTENINLEMPSNRKNRLLFLAIGIAIFIAIAAFYWNSMGNYLYMDDFHWVGRAILAQDSFQDIFAIEGRDFNPVFLSLLWLLIKVFGLSIPLFRWVSVFVFAAVIYTFYFFMVSHFKFHHWVALFSSVLFGINVYISEVVLNLSALVYSLSLLSGLWATIFWCRDRNKKSDKWTFIILMTLAFFTKEVILLLILPLWVYEKDKSNRWFLGLYFIGAIAVRALLQLGATTTSYTSFLSFDLMATKLYFLSLRSLQLSPYQMSPALGIGLLVALIAFSVYLLIAKKERRLLYFLTLCIVFLFFSSLYPKISSRYLLFPSIGAWGIMAVVIQFFYSLKKQYVLYFIVPLTMAFLVTNFIMIQREIGDYKLLGEISRNVVKSEEKIIKEKMGDRLSMDFSIHKGTMNALSKGYTELKKRNNLPKLLPFRAGSIGGVIEPRFLIPIIFYPEFIGSWQTLTNTDNYFKGKIVLK